MVLSNVIVGAIIILLAAGAAYAISIAVRTYRRYHGERIITCPETRNPATVHIDVADAAREALFGKAHIHLDQCSRWPEKKNCGQDCLSEVNADPESCLVWNIVDQWYNGKSCAYCQKPFGTIHWHDRHPALLGPDRNVMQWNEVPPEHLPIIFQNFLPVCWNCYIAETYRRDHPDRMVERPWERGTGGEYVPKESEAAPAPKPITRT